MTLLIHLKIWKKIKKFNIIKYSFSHVKFCHNGFKDNQ